MAEKVKTAMPPDLNLGGSYVIEWDAVDPVTGDSVPGVVVSDTSLGVASLGAMLPAVDNPILIAAGS